MPGHSGLLRTQLGAAGTAGTALQVFDAIKLLLTAQACLHSGAQQPKLPCHAA